MATGVDIDTLLLAAFNAADPRQIDGVGGASSTTSKAALVRASAEPGVDVEYAFAQVGIGDERVEWAGNCGNCATAVALFALHRGLVSITSDTTTVRMININTGARLTGTIPTPGASCPRRGHGRRCRVPPRPAFRSCSAFRTRRARHRPRPADRPAAGQLTGPGRSHRGVPGRSGAPAALFDAKAFGLDGTNPHRFATVVPALTACASRPPSRWVWPGRTIRSAMPCRRWASSPGLPPIAPRRACRHQDEYDLAVRMVSMHAPHPAIGLTSAVALAAAAATPGTLAHRVARRTADGTLRLGTPAGVITTQAVPAPDDASPTVLLHRAARRIAQAELLVPVRKDVPHEPQRRRPGYRHRTTGPHPPDAVPPLHPVPDRRPPRRRRGRTVAVRRR